MTLGKTSPRDPAARAATHIKQRLFKTIWFFYNYILCINVKPPIMKSIKTSPTNLYRDPLENDQDFCKINFKTVCTFHKQI